MIRAARAADAKGSIAILVRNRGHLDHIVPALQDAGIRFRAVEIEQLNEKQVVQDLYALTRALTHPADRIAWLAFFDARLAKFSNGELTLDFSDATKFAEGHDIRATLPKERVAALEASIQRVTGLTVRVTMAS